MRLSQPLRVETYRYQKQCRRRPCKLRRQSTRLPVPDLAANVSDWKEDCSNSTLTNGKLSSVRDTFSRATRPGIVVRSTPRPVTRPQESNRAHSGALCARTVDFCPGGHGERAESRERGGETHLEGH